MTIPTEKEITQAFEAAVTHLMKVGTEKPTKFGQLIHAYALLSGLSTGQAGKSVEKEVIRRLTKPKR